MMSTRPLHDGLEYDSSEYNRHTRRVLRSQIVRTCFKRRYGSKTQARAANATSHWRVRPYYCLECSGYHVANGEKG